MSNNFIDKKIELVNLSVAQHAIIWLNSTCIKHDVEVIELNYYLTATFKLLIRYSRYSKSTSLKIDFIYYLDVVCLLEVGTIENHNSRWDI